LDLAHEAGSSATVLETYVSLGVGAYWTNVVTQIAIAVPTNNLIQSVEGLVVS